MRLRNDILILLSALLLCLPAAGLAQQEGQATGQQQGQSGGQGQAGQSSQPLAPVSAEAPAQPTQGGQTPAAAADARSFGGAEGYSVGSSGILRGYFIPSFQFSEMGDSNFSLGSGPQSFETINALVGRIDYMKVSRRNQITLEYFGGGTIYNHHSDLNSLIQQFGFTESYQGRRWSFLLDDRAAYLPESSFGYGGFGFGGALGVDLGGATGSNLSSISSILNPTSGVLTARGPRVTNTTIVQIQYLASSRSALTVAVSYGFLRFNHSGMIGSRNATAMVGYSHSFTPRDNVGLNYSFGEFRFPGSGISFNTHVLQASYGHRISGRLSMQVGAGPQINVISNPVSGSSTPVSWSTQFSMDYRARKGDLTANYFRNTTNGGGLLTGASTDNVSLAWSTGLGRHWFGSIGPGYSRNLSIPQTNVSGAQSKYNAESVTATLSRLFGRYTSMFLTYTFQNQNSNFSPCLVGNCGTSLQRQIVGIGFDFHPRQISIE